MKVLKRRDGYRVIQTVLPAAERSQLLLPCVVRVGLSPFCTDFKIVILELECYTGTTTTTSEWKQSTGHFPEPGQICPQVKHYDSVFGGW